MDELDMLAAGALLVALGSVVLGLLLCKAVSR